MTVLEERPDQASPDQEGPWYRRYSELGVSLLLFVVGLLVVVDTTLESGSGGNSDPLGPHAVAFVVGGALVLLAVLLTVDVLRGGHGEAEAGEDIDLSTPPDLRTVGMLAGILVATAVLIPLLGWPIAGTVLFWGATYSLGSRTIVRDFVIAAGVSLVTWVLFDALLGVDLPGGPLMGLFG
jgi:putative tricarboxylic transport membrane protein